MRLNLCQYHVQNRNYSKGEVLSLINNDSFKHHILSGNEHFYSTGTMLELLGTGAFFSLLIVDAFSNSNNKIPTSGQHLTQSVSKYKVTDIKDENYNAKEVTEFLNKFHNVQIGFNNNAYYDDIINDFINHKFDVTTVPILGNDWTAIAVLDLTGVVA